MLTRVDHVMVCVTDLEPGIEAYRRLGFNIHPGGVHTGRGTHNAIAFLCSERARYITGAVLTVTGGMDLFTF